jgi:hypothetical protein
MLMHHAQIEARRQRLSQQTLTLKSALEQRIIEERAGALAARAKGVSVPLFAFCHQGRGLCNQGLTL